MVALPDQNACTAPPMAAHSGSGATGGDIAAAKDGAATSQTLLNLLHFCSIIPVIVIMSFF